MFNDNGAGSEQNRIKRTQVIGFAVLRNKYSKDCQIRERKKTETSRILADQQIKESRNPDQCIERMHKQELLCEE